MCIFLNQRDSPISILINTSRMKITWEKKGKAEKFENLKKKDCNRRKKKNRRVHVVFVKVWLLLSFLKFWLLL